MDPSTVTRLTFGEFTLELQPARLLKGEVSVPLQSQPLRLLSLLVAHAGEVVTHKEIQKHVWGELQVDFASGMHVCIGQIRKALEDVGEQPRYVETIPRRGYRFVAEVLPSRVSPVAAEDARPHTAVPVTARGLGRTRRLQVAGLLLLAALVLALALARPGLTVSGEVTVPPDNAYLDGMRLLATGNLDDALRSREFLARAITSNPDFAPAHAAMARAYELTREYPEARRFALQAMSIDATYAQSYLRLAAAQAYGDWDWRGAEANLDRALKLAPDDAEALLARASQQLITGSVELAHRTLADALKRHPGSVQLWVEAGLLLYYSGALGPAHEHCSAASKAVPDFQPARLCLYKLARARKDDAAARDQALALMDLAKADSAARAAVEQAAAPRALERFEQWRLAQLEARALSGSSDPLLHAYSLAALGRYDEAFFQLLRAADQHYALTPLSSFDPIYIPIRHQTKFLEMLETMGVVYHEP